ncbi:hypothetical protein CLV28_0991 [Sediminihabitans luteus]|uniref:Uncharacterized protein n=1 Tax=Sediminihabitans luteus TaxID=1138585 RepID=A0A2M9D106_9CELL|nr:hypothetical protein [Sediminihabitans luteus]PJJ77765.1 hypothetical protein CLV28_0991 [Sediminihabitans luteus]GIJ00008.1 hypothetical protein Slu03_23850 [Sediminihabitans luteus]
MAPRSPSELAAWQARRWGRVDDLMTVYLLGCVAVQILLVVVVAPILGATVGSDAMSQVPGIALVRWLAWPPALLFAWIVWLVLPLPRVLRPSRTTATVRRPAFGRGLVLLYGAVGLVVTAGQSVLFTSEDGGPVASGWVAVVMLVLLGVLVLRIVLGGLRLLPRAWRVAPAA